MILVDERFLTEEDRAFLARHIYLSLPENKRLLYMAGWDAHLANVENKLARSKERMRDVERILSAAGV